MRPTGMRTPVLLATALLLLAACGDDTTAPPSGQPAATLDGRTFVGDRVDGHSLVKGSTLRFAFQDGEINVQAGCNHLFGTARLDNGTLLVSQMGGTEMGCPPDLMDQDAWITDFLQSGPAATVDDRELVLAKDGTTVTLTDEAHIQAQNPIPLVGTTWELESLIQGDAASSVPGRTPTIRLTGDRIEVFTGCNRGSAPVEVGDSTMNLGLLALTKMACKQSAESEVVAVLQGEVAYVQDYDVLTLVSGKNGLQFRAAS